MEDRVCEFTSDGWIVWFCFVLQMDGRGNLVQGYGFMRVIFWFLRYVNPPLCSCLGAPFPYLLRWAFSNMSFRSVVSIEVFVAVVNLGPRKSRVHISTYLDLIVACTCVMISSHEIVSFLGLRCRIYKSPSVSPFKALRFVCRSDISKSLVSNPTQWNSASPSRPSLSSQRRQAYSN